MTRRLRKTRVCISASEKPAVMSSSVMGACGDDTAIRKSPVTREQFQCPGVGRSQRVLANSLLISGVLCQLKFFSCLRAHLKSTFITLPCRYMGFFPLLIQQLFVWSSFILIFSRCLIFKLFLFFFSHPFCCSHRQALDAFEYSCMFSPSLCVLYGLLCVGVH